MSERSVDSTFETVNPRKMSKQVSRGSAGEYQADELYD